MGEWSEYFEDFPEENPANYVHGRFAPELAKTIHEQESRIAAAKAEINRILLDAWLEEKPKYYLLTEECPQCGLEELKTYNVRNEYYLCECEECGIFGKGDTHRKALEATASALGDGADWRETSEPWAR